MRPTASWSYRYAKSGKGIGDYLIVGVTNDNFDREQGKPNVKNNVFSYEYNEKSVRN